MYADNTLTPKEAIRLCALGTLAGGAMRYDELANAIRHFISRITGPSLELMGESIELLRYEGLVTATDENSENESGDGNTVITITDDGWSALHELLAANLRPGGSDINDLIIALKFRFLHLLPLADQLAQTDILAEATETELGRLEDLKRHHADDPGFLVEWLDESIRRLEERLDWLSGLKTRLSPPGSAAEAG